jgi:hypothetical protein
MKYEQIEIKIYRLKDGPEIFASPIQSPEEAGITELRRRSTTKSSFEPSKGGKKEPRI